MRADRGARRGAVLAVAVAVAACAPSRRALPATDQAAIAGAALTTLFLEREHAGELILWDGTLREAPALSELALGDSLDVLRVVPVTLPVPVHTIGLDSLEAHFRAHAEAWGAWYAAHPRSGGIVAVTAPLRAVNDAGRASVLVGRLCGDHCRQVWRVVARRDGETWRTDSVSAVRVPKS